MKKAYAFLTLIGVVGALSGQSGWAQTQIDVTPPPPPTGFRIVALSSNQITLAWDANPVSTGTVGYQVYFGNASRNYPFHHTLAGDVTQFTISALRPELTYYFAITAFDEAGNESSVSIELAIAIGVSRLSPIHSVRVKGTSMCSGYLTVQLTPNLAVLNGAKWRIAPRYIRYGRLTRWSNTSAKIPLQNGAFEIQFSGVPGFYSPLSYPASIPCNTRSNLIFRYTQILR